MDAIASPVLTPIRLIQAPLRGKIIDTLRSAIEAGGLEPGMRLVERDLCEKLGVSRTALREALRELQADGVIGHSDTGRLIVAPLDRSEAENAYRIRGALEALAVAQFIEKAGERQYENVARLGEALLDAYRIGEVATILGAKRAFYDAICVGAGNPLAFAMINRLVLRTSSLRRRSLSRRQRQAQSIVEIAALLQAMARRDIDAARIAAERHVQEAALSAFEADVV